MEKVKLPREVAEAIESIREAGMTDFTILGEAYKGNKDYPYSVITNYIRQNTMAFDDEEKKGFTIIMKALVIGYEVEHIPTPREKVQKLLQTYYGYHPNDETMSEIESLYNINEVSE
ncbi:DUF1642 domain-containing protein [Paenibacillus agaridevorans]|uniref:DUF1642 domain-containing protein n=1 Tax=Paenibacillus agaridevorans TaxID=171404 RepID=UPI001BE42B82|nr:DUF1642 domain-containing protein [Paenibacillus agaridevorans]